MKESTTSTAKHFIGKLTCALLVVLGLLVTFSQESQAAKPGSSVQPVGTLTAKAVSESQVGLAWSYADASSISGYSVERSQSPTSGFQAIATAAPLATSLDDSPLAGGKSYYYRIRAFTKNGKNISYSSYSPVAAATTPVAADTTAPTVSITSPAAGTTFTSAQTVTIAVAATDDVGLSKVELYDGSALRGTDTAAPYAFAWTVAQADNGSHSFTAKAYDAAGNSMVSSPAGLNVNIAAAAPGSFEFSASAYSVSEGAGKVDITVKRVGGSAGAVAVDFRTGLISAKYGEDYVGISQTTLTFANGEATKTMSVSLIDDTAVEGDETFKVLLSSPTGGATLGAITTGVITIKDNDTSLVDLTAPAVSITSPAAGSTYTTAQTVTISASATDNVGVSKIELYDGATLLATDSVAPYSFAWAITSAKNGTHNLAAKAYDASGNSSVSSATAVTVNIPPVAAGPLKVFPGAEGFGTETVAGRGGKIIKVTNLNDSGAGSLRAAVQASGPRIVVFEVSGVINLQDFIQIRNPFLTIAGQTAPSPGITLKGKGCLDIRTHDVLIQHLRLRGGDPNGTAPVGYEDGFQITGSSTAVYNIVIDHVSASWALDENGAIWVADNITISNSIFSESIYSHKGFLIGNNSDNITFHNNLLMHNSERHPRINAGTSVVMFNNLFYDIGVGAHTEIGQPNGTMSTPNPDHAAIVSAVGNVYLNKSGSTKRAFNVFTSADHIINSGTKLYLQDNLVDGSSLAAWHISFKTIDPQVNISPLPLDGYTIVPAEQVQAHLLQHAGARPIDRDMVDQRMITELIGFAGSIPASVDALGSNGWPALASAINYRSFNEGTNPNGDDDGDGYTNVEELLHQMILMVED